MNLQNKVGCIECGITSFDDPDVVFFKVTNGHVVCEDCYSERQEEEELEEE